MGSVSAKSDGCAAQATITLIEKHLWNVGEPELYDLGLILEKDGKQVDCLQSYFGLRSVWFDGMKFMINDKPVFQRLVLDQGFYPDGIYTAPTDEALKADIELSMAMGFNGARLHEKVFEARFLYHADHMATSAGAKWRTRRLTIAAILLSPISSTTGSLRSSAITARRASSVGARSTRPGTIRAARRRTTCCA